MQDAGVRQVNYRTCTTISNADVVAGNKRAFKIYRPVSDCTGHADAVTTIEDQEALTNMSVTMSSDGQSVGRHLLNSHVVQAGDCYAGNGSHVDADITVCNVNVIHK